MKNCLLASGESQPCLLFDSLYEVSRAEFHVEATPAERPQPGLYKAVYPPNCLILEVRCCAPVTETKSPVSLRSSALERGLERARMAFLFYFSIFFFRAGKQ